MSDDTAPSPDPVPLVRRFAISLDQEDYDETRRCLDPDCVYVIRDATHRGPEAIVASYQGNGDWASENIDRIEYESQVEADGTEAALIIFYDHLTHGGRKLSHRCHQWCHVGPRGIDRIEHRDLPGEKEALDAFKRETGLIPPE